MYLIDNLREQSKLCVKFEIKYSEATYCLHEDCGKERHFSEILYATTIILTVPENSVERANVHTLFYDNFKPTALKMKKISTECHLIDSHVMKRKFLTSIPENMVLQLSRFSKDIGTRVQTLVDIPLELDVSPYLLQQSSKNSNMILTGVLWHEGGTLIAGGHYTSTVWIPQVKSWVFFNDMLGGGVLEQDNWWKVRQTKQTCAVMLLYTNIDEL
jgi:hypothetical protein